MQQNIYISKLYPTGTYLPSAKYTHKQCGEYLNDNFLKTRMISSSLQSKKNLVSKYGFLANFDKVKVGDVVVMDYGTSTGHITIVNTKDEVKRRIRMTDCNLTKVGVVNNDFWAWENDAVWKKIFGFARLPLNAKTEAAQPQSIPAWAVDAVNKAKAKGVIKDWSNPNEEVGSEKLEWIFENLGWLDKSKHEGKISLLRLAVMLDKQKLLD